jgi:hypothetical protein
MNDVCRRCGNDGRTPRCPDCGRVADPDDAVDRMATFDVLGSALSMSAREGDDE